MCLVPGEGGGGIKKLTQTNWLIRLNWKLFSWGFRVVVKRLLPCGHFGTKLVSVSGLVFILEPILWNKWNPSNNGQCQGLCQGHGHGQGWEIRQNQNKTKTKIQNKTKKTASPTPRPDESFYKDKEQVQHQDETETKAKTNAQDLKTTSSPKPNPKTKLR